MSVTRSFDAPAPPPVTATLLVSCRAVHQPERVGLEASLVGDGAVVEDEHVERGGPGVTAGNAGHEGPKTSPQRHEVHTKDHKGATFPVVPFVVLRVNFVSLW